MAVGKQCGTIPSYDGILMVSKGIKPSPEIGERYKTFSFLYKSSQIPYVERKFD